jgi:NAD(P)-dependent dehydrogenase (short-subunit alcohol dehydrogenase family)
MSRVILVTGANTGIGFELVRLLAEEGHKVYLGARNEAAGKEAEYVVLPLLRRMLLVDPNFLFKGGSKERQP